MVVENRLPTFSVIIAAYNAAETIGRAIESVLEQSPPVELIVVDDGSNDTTPEVVVAYGSRVLYHRQDNSGVARARNTGVGLATGDWIAFLDADDWYYPERISLYQELISKNPELDLVVGDFHYCDSVGKVICRAMESTSFGCEVLSRANKGEPQILESSDMESFIANYFSHTLAFSLPRGRFLSLGGYPDFRVAEDLSLLIQACAVSHRIGVICKPVGAYIVHDSGLVRANLMSAQSETVRALSTLLNSLHAAPPNVRTGLKRCYRSARLDMAVLHLKSGRNWEAIASVLPLLLHNPGLNSVRDVLSVMRGIH